MLGLKYRAFPNWPSVVAVTYLAVPADHTSAVSGAQVQASDSSVRVSAGVQGRVQRPQPSAPRLKTTH